MICVDSSIVIKLLIDEPKSDVVSSLWKKWEEEGLIIYAPFLLHYEVYSALRNKTHRGLFDERDQKRMLNVYQGFNITFIADTESLVTAIDLANRYNLPVVYDAIYLALSQKMSLEFWTADLKLARLVSKKLPFVKAV